MMDANEIKQLSTQLDELRRKMEDALTDEVFKRATADGKLDTAQDRIQELEQQLSAAQASLMAHSPEYMDTVAELGERMYESK